MLSQLRTGDQKLVQIVDAALADAARRSGDWLACKLGCTQCCIGVFAINQLDAARLRQGLAEVERSDPWRAARLRERARTSIARIQGQFPGDTQTGILDTSEDAAVCFEDFANDEPCPALDPATGACDLYAARPMTCRVFGPPVRSDDGLGVCELCYHGATDEEIAACKMMFDAQSLEDELVQQLDRDGSSQTIVAYALVSG